ncbi:MAG TPA: HlyD family efflux transporter periplasmic adaptor subunit [Longimicrobiales bacterium]|nr:HlyD family efflux transporter periplasmic adaptor subunit [Longimicrobiales bacterium]
MKRRIGVAAMLVAVAALVAFLVFGSNRGETTLEASGTVEATESDLGFQLPGRIASVAVREGDLATRGAELARLEAADLEARVAAARAQAAAARAVLAELEAGARNEEVAQGRAGLRAAQRRVEDAARDLERARRLFEGGAVSREALDKAGTAYAVAEAALDQAREQLGVLETGPRPERVAAQRANVAAAEAAVRQAEALVDQALIRAPFTGRVTIRHREAGETVQPGQPVVTLMDPDDRWVRIYIPEDRIGAVSVGQSATIRSDTYPDRSFEGRVVHVAREAEFTPRNVQTREERVKLVYAVRIAISGDPELVLKPGVPADVRLVEPAAGAPEPAG